VQGDLILVGRVARAHGNKGQVIVNPETDFADDRFAAGRTVIVAHRGQEIERRIDAVRFQQGRPIVALHGVETMNDAEALAGAELRMPAAALAPLPRDTFYRHDLIGCEVADADGRVLGRVTDVEGPIERSLLIVTEGPKELMIPMVDGMVRTVDLAARRIVVELPNGLLDL
jgi:16S rRNA processing protein RimM